MSEITQFEASLPGIHQVNKDPKPKPAQPVKPLSTG